MDTNSTDANKKCISNPYKNSIMNNENKSNIGRCFDNYSSKRYSARDYSSNNEYLDFDRCCDDIVDEVIDKKDIRNTRKQQSCNLHSTEIIRWYCYLCEQLICIECLLTNHQTLEHRYENITQTEIRFDKKLADIVSQSNNQINEWKNTPLYEKTLREVDFQYVQVEDKINETYEIYKTILKEFRDNSLVDLKELREKRKTEVVDAYHKMNKLVMEIKENVQKTTSNYLKRENELDNINFKATLIKELSNRINKISEMNDIFYINFQFNPRCFEKVINDFHEMRAKDKINNLQRIYHSSNPFMNELTETQKLKLEQLINNNPILNLNNINTDADIHSDSSKPSSISNKQTVTDTNLNIEPHPEEKLNVSDKINLTSSAVREVANKSPIKYVLTGSIDNRQKISMRLQRRINEFSCPQDLCLSENGDIIVADTKSHEIKIFDKDGNFKLKFGMYGNKNSYFIYPKYVTVFLNNSQNRGNIVVYDKVDWIPRLQMFANNGVFLKSAVFKIMDFLKALATTNNDRIVALDQSKQIFVISDTLIILKKIDCKQFLIEPITMAIKGEEIFISDKKKVCVTVINNEGQFLGHIGYKNQNRPSQGIGFVNDTILISFSDFKEVQIYEFSKNGSCSFKYELRNIKVLQSDRFEISSNGSLVLLNKMNDELLILNM